MSKKIKVLAALGGLLVGSSAISWLLTSGNIDVLNPAGTIAEQQKDLIYISVLLMLIVVVPVFIMVFVFAWRFRENNKSATYQPEWDHSKKLEAVWWSVPLIIILILGGIIWQTSHSLDPFRPLSSQTKPLTVQVVALQWKWLFIYPEHNIATVNQLTVPVDTPLNFEITADAPMNSFWIPRLGGQVYAMAGMKTKLHLIADEPGNYRGYSANISGKGFADMRFNTTTMTEAEFGKWLSQASGTKLTMAEYSKLATPSRNAPKLFYASVETGLMDKIIDKYMKPPADQKVEPLPDEHNKVHDHEQEHAH